MDYMIFTGWKNTWKNRKLLKNRNSQNNGSQPFLVVAEALE